jgi:hypothetical protein
MAGKTAERPEKQEGCYYKPSLGKNVKRVTILGIASCSAIRGMGRLGFTISQGVKIAEHFGATLNPRTVNSHIRLGKEGSDKYGSIPTLSKQQLAECVGVVGKPGVKAETVKVEAKAVKPKSKKVKVLKVIEMASEPQTVKDCITHEKPREAVSLDVQRVRSAIA